MRFYMDPDKVNRAIDATVRENMAFSASRSATEVYLWSRLAQSHVKVDSLLYSARPIPSR